MIALTFAIRPYSAKFQLEVRNHNKNKESYIETH